jgi:hypothetical protein
MSDTPRTDEVASHEGSWDTKALRMTHYARYIERELDKAQNILKQCLSIMPVGYVPTHTVENLPEMIGDLAKALAEETTEREKLERELAEARQQRETLAEALREIKESEPANHNGELFYPRYSQDGDWIGDEPVDPLSLLAFIYPRAVEALAAVKGGSHE